MTDSASGFALIPAVSSSVMCMVRVLASAAES